MGMLTLVSKMLTLSRFLLKFLREKKPCASCQKHSVSSQEGASITHDKKDLKTYRRLADLRDMCTCMSYSFATPRTVARQDPLPMGFLR